MDWISGMQKAIDYIEEHLIEKYFVFHHCYLAKLQKTKQTMKQQIQGLFVT